MKNILLKLLPLIDFLLVPFVYLAAAILKNVRRAGVYRLPRSKSTLLNIGVFPLVDHYYEPQFKHEYHDKPLNQDRSLPGIDWNVEGQRELLSKLNFAGELSDVPTEKPKTLEYYLNNEAFLSGDAEYWYQLIRLVKPRRIFEVGSGNSTLMGIRATRKNTETDPLYRCKHVCIEPYEMPWLEETGVIVLRKRIEDVDIGFFSELEANDILFIDSSHIIRPQGDVLFEYLELLPTLKNGVIVHVHDIFSPKNYLKQWVEDEIKFWNEQYLLEAFLSHNSSWKILGSLNYLHHHHYAELKAVAPYLTPDREPGSFYIQKIA